MVPKPAKVIIFILERGSCDIFHMFKDFFDRIPWKLGKALTGFTCPLLDQQFDPWQVDSSQVLGGKVLE